MRRLNSKFPNLIGAGDIEIYRLRKEETRIKDLAEPRRSTEVYNAIRQAIEYFGVNANEEPSQASMRSYVGSVIERWGNLCIQDLYMCFEVIFQRKVNFDYKTYGKFDFLLYAELVEHYRKYRAGVTAKVSQSDDLKTKYELLVKHYANLKEIQRQSYNDDIEVIYAAIMYEQPIREIAGTPVVHGAKSIIEYCELHGLTIKPVDHEVQISKALVIAKEQFTKLLIDAKFTKSITEYANLSEATYLHKATQRVYIDWLYQWVMAGIRNNGYSVEEVKKVVFANGYPNEKELYDRFKLEPIYIAYQAIL